MRKSDAKFNRRPRVLHVIEATLGGTLRYMKDLVEVMPTETYQFGLAFADARADPVLEAVLEDAQAKGWETFNVPMVREVSPMHDCAAVVSLRRILQNYQPDLLHCHSSKAGAVGRIAAQLVSPKVRVLYSPHAMAVGLGAQYIVAERVLGMITTRFGAVSDSEREELLRYGLGDPESIDVLYPRIDVNHYIPLDRTVCRTALGIPQDANLMVGIGRLTAQKNPLLFLDIFERVARESKRALAIWVGDGELSATLHDAIRQRGMVDLVRLVGWKSDVRPYLAASNLLLSTSRYESFGYMVAEAMAMERPIVATNISGTTDVVSKEFKDMLYPCMDAEHGSRLVNALLRNPIEAANLGKRVRLSIMARFTADQMVRSFSSSYSKCLA